MAVDDVFPHHRVLRVLISILEVRDGGLFLRLSVLLLLFYLWRWLRRLLNLRHTHGKGQAIFTKILGFFVAGAIIVVILKLVFTVLIVLCLRYNGITEKLVEVYLLIC